ncbi:hypothetical protein CFAM422_009041 [Trichoderma lentiforme]|uniref:Uncharacterized protein n=1 Tax=Trichoderma lentiforme TaxID=1567552 RepID=A0A9P4X8G8_9HYPO|nr:hypothetical protein CFAM422_009041 [Trichoderma lentiforme]
MIFRTRFAEQSPAEYGALIHDGQYDEQIKTAWYKNTIIATGLPLLSLHPHALIPNAKHAADVGTVILQKPCFVYALAQQLGVHNGAENCIQGMES